MFSVLKSGVELKDQACQRRAESVPDLGNYPLGPLAAKRGGHGFERQQGHQGAGSCPYRTNSSQVVATGSPKSAEGSTLSLTFRTASLVN